MQPVIVLVEDDKELREFVSNLLLENGFAVHSSARGTEALQLIENLSPDLVLLDLNLPDINGETICKQVKRQDSAIKVIMLTAKDTTRDIAEGLNIGADDYIAKPFDPEVLIARINARLRTNKLNASSITIDDLVINMDTHEINRGERSIKLTPQEFKLLHYFATHTNQVLTRDMILARIWESSPDIETRVVDVYVGYLRKKIDKPFKNKLIHSVRGFGYILKTPKTA